MQIAVKLGLSVPVVADRDVQLGYRLLREERAQEPDQQIVALDENVEGGKGEAEDLAHLRLGQQHGVHEHARAAVVEREHQRDHAFGGDDAAHEIRRFVAVEGRPDHLDSEVAPHRHDGPQVEVDLGRDQIRIPLDVLVRRREPVVAQNLANDQPGLAAAGVGAEDRLRRSDLDGSRVPVEELDPPVDPDRAEDRSRHGVEERPGELGVVATSDQAAEAILDRSPERLVAQTGAEKLRERRRDLLQDLVVEVQAFQRVLVAALPVTALEPPPGPLRDAHKLVGVRLKATPDPGGRRAGQFRTRVRVLVPRGLVFRVPRGHGASMRPTRRSDHHHAAAAAGAMPSGSTEALQVDWVLRGARRGRL